MIEKSKFGKTKDGKEVTLYSISNSKGMRADVTDYGANLVNLLVPNKKGKVADVITGYEKIDKYFTNGCFFGASVGPIANRTAGAKFKIDGKTYKLDVNDGKNNLHSHFEKGFHKLMWDAKVNAKKNAVKFTLTMKDKELGLPGNRTFTITYSVTEENGLLIEYTGESDKDTIYNPTNHSYFNLAGHETGSILDEELWLNCDKYTEIVAGAIPTGNLPDVKGTPLDFTKKTAIGKRIRSRFEQMTLVGGYDHNFVSNAKKGKFEKIAVLSDKKAGRTMEVYTDMPGIQLYTANFVNNHKGKGGAQYKKRCAVALETQYFPNSANDPNFDKPLLKAGKKFKSKTEYRFV